MNDEDNLATLAADHVRVVFVAGLGPIKEAYTVSVPLKDVHNAKSVLVSHYGELTQDIQYAAVQNLHNQLSTTHRDDEESVKQQMIYTVCNVVFWMIGEQTKNFTLPGLDIRWIVFSLDGNNTLLLCTGNGQAEFLSAKSAAVGKASALDDLNPSRTLH